MARICPCHRLMDIANSLCLQKQIGPRVGRIASTTSKEMDRKSIKRGRKQCTCARLESWSRKDGVSGDREKHWESKGVRICKEHRLSAQRSPSYDFFRFGASVRISSCWRMQADDHYIGIIGPRRVLRSNIFRPID